MHVLGFANSIRNANIARMPLCLMRAWGGGAKCDTFFAMRFLGTCQRRPRGAQRALHHDVGCLASLTAAEDLWTITLLLRPRDTVRCPRGEGISQPLFMKVTTPPR